LSRSCVGPSEALAVGAARSPVLFGRRRGRALRPGQKVLIRNFLPQIALTIPVMGEFDLRGLFDARVRLIWVEIGFGGGEHLADQAVRHPGIGLIGCEIFENGIAKLLARIKRSCIENIRIFTGDGRVLIAALPPASLDRVFILFPDPWPKRRHEGRRIVSRELLDALARVMTDGAELRLATDDRDLLSWMLERATDHPAFEWLARGPCDWRERLPDWPLTRYEEKAQAAGRPAVFLRFRRQVGR
jgi:tRNA (guanine-N7-)-methyltransferase